MPRKQAPKWDDPEESGRFLEAAKAAEASEDATDFDKALKAVAPDKRRTRTSNSQP